MRSNVGTYGDVGLGGDGGPGGDISLKTPGPRRHYKRHAVSFPAAILLWLRVQMRSELSTLRGIFRDFVLQGPRGNARNADKRSA